ncbi:MAG: hypothetical protein C4346_13600 [Chloroflexota bacterium]
MTPSARPPFRHPEGSEGSLNERSGLSEQPSACADAAPYGDLTADSEWLFERDSSAAPLPRYRERNDYGAHSIARFTNALSRTE